jgi:hypothetical protein
MAIYVPASGILLSDREKMCLILDFRDDFFDLECVPLMSNEMVNQVYTK